jgi:hypothetical protein
MSDGEARLEVAGCCTEAAQELLVLKIYRPALSRVMTCARTSRVDEIPPPGSSPPRPKAARRRKRAGGHLATLATRSSLSGAHVAERHRASAEAETRPAAGCVCGTSPSRSRPRGTAPSTERLDTHHLRSTACGVALSRWAQSRALRRTRRRQGGSAQAPPAAGPGRRRRPPISSGLRSCAGCSGCVA